MSSILKPKSLPRAGATPASAKNKKLFPQKLWDLINDRRYHFCLRWSEDGQLVYLNRDEFEESYLKTAENQFHTQKAISFVRQMNMYGFRKVDDCYYENDNFKRDCEHLLKNMMRKHPSKNGSPLKLEPLQQHQPQQRHHHNHHHHHHQQEQQQQQQQQQQHHHHHHHQQQQQQQQQQRLSYQQARVHQMHQVQQVQQALQLQQLQQLQQDQQQQALQAQQQADLDSSTALANLISIYLYAMLNNR